MKPIQSTELMDLTNVIKQYIHRKKPNGRKILSKINGPTLIVQLQPKRTTSTASSHQTLQIKSRINKQPLITKQLKQSRHTHSIQPNTQTNLIKQVKNHQSFRILKPRSRVHSQMPSLAFKKHFMSVQESKVQRKMIRQRYWIQQTLKRSLHSTVYRCKDSLKQTQIAVKMFHSVSETNQLKLLRYLDHSSLIKYQNYFIDQQKLYFTMQLYPYNLYQFVSHCAFFKQNKTIIKDIFRKICEGIQHLHTNDQAHCNLKLEHILVKIQKQKVKVAIIDFNNLTRSKDNQKVSKRQLIKNPNYAAPQLLRDKPFLLKPTDCWALGVILYSLLNGRLPFRSKQQIQIQRKICKGKLCFSQNVCDEQRDLIQSILNVNPLERLTIKQILNSSWLN